MEDFERKVKSDGEGVDMRVKGKNSVKNTHRNFGVDLKESGIPSSKSCS